MVRNFDTLGFSTNDHGPSTNDIGWQFQCLHP
ncbi:MAG: hypothetical protein ACI9TB_002142 [Parasphingorhabdus sp.]